MIQKVRNFIKEKEMFEDNAKIVLAFSFGVDSRVLLDILIKLGYNVVLAHVNHKHRLESEIEEQEVIKLAQNLNIPYYIMHLEEDRKENFHLQAHHARYHFFMDVAKKENTLYIATAHHQDDNAETIILNLCKGSNLYGYAGISPIVNKDGIKISRPLLALSKAEIKSYQERHNLKYFEDKSNSEDIFKRNRIRHHIIPVLKEENPNLLNSLMNYSTILKETFNYIRNLSIFYLNKWQNIIIVDEYKKLDSAIRHDILAYYLELFNKNRSFKLITDIDKLLMSNKSQGDYSLNDGFLFKKRYQKAYLEAVKDKPKYYFELTPNNVISTKNMRFYFTKILPTSNANYIKLCYNDLVYPVILRSRQSGDKIHMPYGHKKVKDLLMDFHLPKEVRDEVLILENNGEILWIVGLAKSQKLLSMKNGDIYLVYEVQDEE